MRWLTCLAVVLVSTALLGCGGDTPEPAFARGPYLVRVTTDSAKLRWISRDPSAEVRVHASPETGGLPTRAVDGLFTGLASNTRYNWTATEGDREASGSFVTAPRRLEGTLTFVVFGDHGTGGPDQRAVARVAEAQDPRMLLTTGDNSYLAATPDLLDPNLFEPLRGLQARAPNLGVVGDHDIVFELGRRALVDALEWPGDGDRFDVDYGPVQFIGIGLRGEADDRAHLARALRRRGPEVRFLLVHQPLKAGNPLLPVIERSGLAAVLSGHLHAYERRSVDGAASVPQFTVGTGGASASSFGTPRSDDAAVHLREFGLLRMDVRRGGVHYRFLDTTGTVRDELVTGTVTE